jgi:hypothetical protein
VHHSGTLLPSAISTCSTAAVDTRAAHTQLLLLSR